MLDTIQANRGKSILIALSLSPLVLKSIQSQDAQSTVFQRLLDYHFRQLETINQITFLLILSTIWIRHSHFPRRQVMQPAHRPYSRFVTKLFSLSSSSWKLSSTAYLAAVDKAETERETGRRSCNWASVRCLTLFQTIETNWAHVCQHFHRAHPHCHFVNWIVLESFVEAFEE